MRISLLLTIVVSSALYYMEAAGSSISGCFAFVITWPRRSHPVTDRYVLEATKIYEVQLSLKPYPVRIAYISELIVRF